MSYYQFIIAYHHKFKSDKPDLTENVEAADSLAAKTGNETTPILTVIESLLTQKEGKND
jgi:hypothetical protein